MTKCAFIGLGVMGGPMAGHLSASSHTIKVFNRSPEKANKWCAQYAGEVGQTPGAAAQDAEFIFLCVGRDEDVVDVMTGPDGVLAYCNTDAIIIDHTTTSAHLARDMAMACRQRGAYFLDAPVSGGEAGAVKGQLTVMVGGEPDAFARAEPIISHFAKSVRHMGDAGYGQLTKMVNQICIAGLLEGLSEALHFAEQAGLDIAAVVDVIGKGAAQSWQMDNRALTMRDNQFDFGFAVDWMRKDLSICLEEADRNGASLPVTELVDSYYAEVQRMGGARWDTSSLIARLRAKRDA